MVSLVGPTWQPSYACSTSNGYCLMKAGLLPLAEDKVLSRDIVYRSLFGTRGMVTCHGFCQNGYGMVTCHGFCQTTRGKGEEGPQTVSVQDLVWTMGLLERFRRLQSHVVIAHACIYQVLVPPAVVGTPRGVNSVTWSIRPEQWLFVC